MLGSRERVRLGHAPVRTWSAAAAVGVAVPLAIAGLLVWATLRFLLLPTLATRPIEFWDEVVPAIGLSAIPALIAWFFGFLAYLVVEWVRGARWLAGSWLGQRRVARTVWVDLSTARIETDREHRKPNQDHQQGPPTEHWLVARSATGATVQLPVKRDGQTLLPPAQLTAVAQAITQDRTHLDPDGTSYVVAERLHRLATDPEVDVHGDDTARVRAPWHPSPVFLLVVALLALGLSVTGIRAAAQETEVWLDYRSSQQCRSPTDTRECWTESTATVVAQDASGGTRYTLPSTRYDLQLADGRAIEAEVGQVVEGTAEGDRVDVRVFGPDRVVRLHDGASWLETLAHPQVAMTRTGSFAAVLTGTGIGALIGALAIAGVRGGRWRRRHRDRAGPRHRWAWVGAVFFWAPIPAFGVSALVSGPPIWLLLALTAATGTAVAVISYVRRRTGRGDRTSAQPEQVPPVG